MDTHKGQTKYCITMNDENSDIVKITRAKPGTIPGRWHSEEEVKLDSVSQDVYGTSKQTVEKMFQEIAESKDADSKEDAPTVVADSKDADSKEDAPTVVADSKEADSKEDAEPKINVIEDDSNDAPTVVADSKEDESKDAAGAEPKKQALSPMDELKGRLAEIDKGQNETVVGQGRRTRKNNKRTTRKKHRKGAHSKSNKNKKKHTRGKK